MAAAPRFRSYSRSAQISGNSRTVKYVFSDNSVARDGHTIASAGWQLANFKNNPVFLWAHDAGALPIGKVIDIAASSTALIGTVEYATPDAYPFADTVYQLVRGGFLNATSVSWNPLTWSYSQDKARPGGIDFKTQELLEVSQVPVPALPGALATARARGINTAPIFQWAERLLDKGGTTPFPRSKLEALRTAAKMPAPAPKVRTPFTPVNDLEEREARVRAHQLRNLLADRKLGLIKTGTVVERAEYARKLHAAFS